MLLTLVKFNDGGKIYLENIDGDTFGFRFTHKISIIDGVTFGVQHQPEKFCDVYVGTPKGHLAHPW